MRVSALQPILLRRRPLLGAAVLLLASFTVAAQSLPLIEVAAMRESHNVGVNFAPKGTEFQPGRLRITNLTTEELVAYAHGVRSPLLRDRLIMGWPNTGIREKGFDIAATLTTSEPLAQEEQRRAVLELLTTRFGFKAHTEQRKMGVYRLTMVKPGVLGSGLRRTSVNCAGLSRRPAECGPLLTYPALLHRGSGEVRRLVEWIEGHISVNALARNRGAGGVGLEPRVVVDATGLHGFFVWGLSTGNLATSLREDLGLGLEPGDALADVVVIDDIRMPTPN